MKRRSLFFRITAALLGLTGLAKSADAAVAKTLQRPGKQCWRVQVWTKAGKGQYWTSNPIICDQIEHLMRRCFTTTGWRDCPIMVLLKDDEVVGEFTMEYVTQWTKRSLDGPLFYSITTRYYPNPGDSPQLNWEEISAKPAPINSEWIRAWEERDA